MASIKLIFLAALILALTQSALRFQDQDMMKAHHHQQYPQDGPDLTVHLIPHSHDDVGWLKTVDDYFYGGQNKIQFAGVQYTIDTVVQELSENPEYKFSIVEMAFLYRWWNQATDKQKDQMKKIIANGQLHFINAGWCMSDEANMYYEDFIDNMAVGLKWLRQTLNYVPDMAWHIDPFGHHAASASLFSQMGYNAFFFSRIDYQDKQVRLMNKGMEMIWRPKQYSGDKSVNIFTQVNYYHYSPPPGFCFDDVCRDEPIKDIPNLGDYNVDRRSKQFVDYFKSMALHFRTTNLMHTYGEDFHYTNSRMWYKNTDKLMKYINSRPQFGVKIIYSTPAQYIKAIQGQKMTYPVKNDDFFPYADGAHAFWTGYFVSRVALKGFVKDMSKFIQTVRKHVAELKIRNEMVSVRDNAKQIETNIFAVQMALGILQHHDAVAGTAKQKVTDDYIKTGLRSVNEFNKLYSEIKREQIRVQIGETVNTQDLYFNVFWNETGKVTGLSSSLNSGKTVLVSLYNPGAAETQIIKLKVPPKELNVVSQQNKVIPADILCANLKDNTDCQLIMNIDLQQSGNTYIKLVPTAGGNAKILNIKELSIVEQIKEFTLGSDKVRIVRGTQMIDLTIAGVVQSFKFGYNYYEGYDQSGQKSGAYIFRPFSDVPKVYSYITKIWYAEGVTSGIFILEGDKTFTRLYFSKITDYVRRFGFSVETFMDNIDISDKKGKQVTMNIQTKYKNDKTFYTDSMGLEEQTRIVDFRPQWNYTVFEPTSGNYYPINAFIRINDVNTKRSMTVLSDRSQGGTVVREGQIEIMIHRRLLADDSRGVEEPLNETDAEGLGLKQLFRHNVVFGDEYRTVQKRNDQRPMPVFAPTLKNDFSDKINVRQAPIKVPESVKLYLRPYQDGSYLLRLHNFKTDAQNIVNLPQGWSVQEYTLAHKQLKSQWKAKQLNWNEESKTQELKKEKNILQVAAQKISNIFNFEDIKQEKTLQIKTPPHGKSFRTNAAAINMLPFEMKAFKLVKS